MPQIWWILLISMTFINSTFNVILWKLPCSFMDDSFKNVHIWFRWLCCAMRLSVDVFQHEQNSTSSCFNFCDWNWWELVNPFRSLFKCKCPILNYSDTNGWSLKYLSVKGENHFLRYIGSTERVERWKWESHFKEFSEFP